MKDHTGRRNQKLESTPVAFAAAGGSFVEKKASEKLSAMSGRPCAKDLDGPAKFVHEAHGNHRRHADDEVRERARIDVSSDSTFEPDTFE